MRRFTLTAALAVLAAGAAASESEPLFLPGDPTPVQRTLAALAATPSRGPDPRTVAEPWAVADPRDPALLRHWTSAFTGIGADRGALDAAFREAVARVVDPWPRAAIAFRYLPAPEAARAIAPFADAAFDRGDLRRFLALADARPADARVAVARLLSGDADPVDPSLELQPPGMPESEAGFAAPGDGAGLQDGAGLSVAWSVLPDRLLALDPWGRPRWQRTFAGQAEIRTGAGGAVASDRLGVHLVREDGSVVPVTLPAIGDQRIAVAGSAAWFIRGAAVQRVSFADGAATAFVLPEAPLGAPLVRGPRSLWLTAHELVLIDGSVPAGRIRHGEEADARWRIAARQERIHLLAPQASFRIPPLATQLAAAPAPRRALLLSRAGRHAEVLALVARDSGALAHPDARRSALRAHLALGTGGTEELLGLAADPGERARVLAAAVLAGSGVDPRLEALVDADADLRFPAVSAQLAEEPDAWDQVLSGRALLGRPVDDPRYAVSDEADRTTVTCSDGSGNRFRWSNRWAAEPIPSGAPRRSILRRGSFLVVSEGIGRLVVLDPARGDALGAVDMGRFDAEPTQATVLGRDGAGVLRIALLHPPAIDDHLTILGSDGSAATTALAVRARAVERLSVRQARVVLEDGTNRIVGDPAP